MLIHVVEFCYSSVVDPLSASLPIAPVSSLASLAERYGFANTNTNASGGTSIQEKGCLSCSCSTLNYPLTFVAE